MQFEPTRCGKKAYSLGLLFNRATAAVKTSEGKLEGSLSDMTINIFRVQSDLFIFAFSPRPREHSSKIWSLVQDETMQGVSGTECMDNNV